MMLRYFEYVYLLVALGLVAYLATGFSEVDDRGKIAMIIAIVICSFMFSFRRQQRLRVEAEEAEELRKLEEEVNDDGA